MPATPSRIGFITQAYRIATAGPVSAVVDLYGNAARKTTEPLPSFFDNASDAQVIADERIALLGAGRTMNTAQIDQVDAAVGIDPSFAPPTARIIDDEQEIDRAGVVVGLTIDMNTERSTLQVWG